MKTSSTLENKPIALSFFMMERDRNEIWSFQSAMNVFWTRDMLMALFKLAIASCMNTSHDNFTETSLWKQLFDCSKS